MKKPRKRPPGRRDRPKQFLGYRTWLVKLRGVDKPVEVVAEHRAAARHYVKSFAPDELELWRDKGHHREVEWCRLKRETEEIPF